MNQLNCVTFKEMVVSGYNNLENKHEEIDRLNVFPVPDGDTGTNMKMTFGHGVNEVVNYMNNHIGDTAKFLSRNMLMGARGNSGVILSQVFKGIAKGVEGKEEINVDELAKAFLNGAKVAYKAVMRPVEGTILTVVRESAEYGVHFVKKNPKATVEEYFDYLLTMAVESLNRTPELLPVLKEANVVDSGAAGYVTILEGFNSYLKGNPVVLAQSSETKKEEKISGYCVEVSIDLNDMYTEEFSNKRLETSLARTCSNIKINRIKDTVNLHVHSSKPGDIINTAQRFGEMTFISVTNLKDGDKETLDYSAQEVQQKKYAIISVCSGSGIADKFKELGVEYIVSGGQTMNPATEDFVKIINEAHADNVIILPNNSNIILAANQAKDICSDLNVEVLPSKSIPAGIAACINFNGEAKLEDNVAAMNEAIEATTTVSITTAVKNTTINNIEIHENDFMGLVNKDIVATGLDLVSTTKKTLDTLDGNDIGYITVIYGQQTDEETAQAILDYAVEKYDIDGELIAGKQDLYPFVIGVE